MIRRLVTDSTSGVQAAVRCVNCEAFGLYPVLDLGDMPLANSLIRPGENPDHEIRYPLELCFCESCSLVQISVRVSPEHLFTEYCYYSSFSDTMVAHARGLAERMTQERTLDQSSLVLEAGSNDGYLLQWYRKLGVGVLGIEPAQNIAREALAKGIPTRSEFFGEPAAHRLVKDGLRADIFHAHNVMAHVPDQNGFIKGIATILKDDGVAIIEAPYVGDMIEHLEFDTIYHEHVCYFSVTSFVNAFARHGMKVIDVERVAIHGGSLRIFAAPLASPRQPSDRVHEMLERERTIGLDRTAYYQDFARRVDELRTALVGMVKNIVSSGQRVAAYGASAKGATLLNYCGLGADLIDFVVDRNPVKHDSLMPGCHLPIRAPSELLERMPSHALLLTWNFADEILAQQSEYRRRGGNFIVPVPFPTIIPSSQARAA